MAVANKFANLAFTRSLLNLPATSTYSLQISLSSMPSIFKWTKPGEDASSSIAIPCSGRFELELDNASIRKRYSNLSRWAWKKRKKTCWKIWCHIPLISFDSTSYRYERFAGNFTFIRRGSFNETRNTDENLGSRVLARRIKRWINFSTVASIAKTGLETSVIESHWKIFNSSWLSCEFDIYIYIRRYSPFSASSTSLRKYVFRLHSWPLVKVSLVAINRIPPFLHDDLLAAQPIFSVERKKKTMKFPIYEKLVLLLL